MPTIDRNGILGSMTLYDNVDNEKKLQEYLDYCHRHNIPNVSYLEIRSPALNKRGLVFYSGASPTAATAIAYFEDAYKFKK